MTGGLRPAGPPYTLTRLFTVPLLARARSLVNAQLLCVDESR